MGELERSTPGIADPGDARGVFVALTNSVAFDRRRYVLIYRVRLPAGANCGLTLSPYYMPKQ